ncbi:MAG: alkyl hydroperoxide reductase subunit F [Bdellovibrionales bacterium]|nr:alkyl hydroperoxide reductase subunit F [Bdellovibrionales bacterium]
MLDKQMIAQLQTVFKKLTNTVELVYLQSGHAKQQELVLMLTEIADTSSNIKLSKSDKQTDSPYFFIKYNKKQNGISFLGIPSGHEFTSLILAILNSDNQGKLPDQGIINRIKNLNGPIELKTYISLSCENCPEVIQSLNLMTVFNSNFTHQMIDGEFAQEDIKKLKIQGVPSVIDGEVLISSGKTNLADLLTKLEQKYGSKKIKNLEQQDLGEYDVVVAGAGPAGAAAAIYSSRKGLKTALVAEKMGGQVKDTKGIENLISVTYTEGPALADKLSKHIAEYDIKLFEHRRIKSIENNKLKNIILDSGEFLKTKSIIVATGAKWRELGIEGEKKYTGRGVAYCPHCDGPYYKQKDVAVIGGGNSGVEAAIDLAGIVKSVVLFEFLPELKADKVLVNKLKSLKNVKIITNAQTNKVIGDDSKVTHLEYKERDTEKIKQVSLDGVFVQIGLLPNSKFIKDIVETNSFGEIIIDNKCRTNIKGIYAAGDVTTVPFKQIIIAMGEGAKASLTAFEDQTFN